MKHPLKTYAVLKGERNYWFYLVSIALSRLGDSIDSLAYSWIAYQLTGSAVWLTIIIGVNALPTIFLTPFLAPIVERMNKKRVMIVTGIIRVSLTLITGAAMALSLLTAPLLLAATFLMSVSESFSDPAYMASVPAIIPSDKMDAGIALRSTVSQTAQLIGAGLGGLCLGLIGGGGALLVDGTLFALATLALLFLKLSRNQMEEQPQREGARYLDTLKEGMRYFIRRPALVLLAMMNVGVNIVLSPMNQLMTAYVVEDLRLDAYALSVCGVASSVGLLLGSMAYPMVKGGLTAKRSVVLIGWAVALEYLAQIALGWVSGLEWLKYGALFLMNLSVSMVISFYSVMTSVLFFRVIEESYLSRMASIFNSLGMLAVPAASLFSGSLVSVFPIKGVYLITAALTLCLAFIAMRLKAMRELDALGTDSNQVKEELDNGSAV